MPHSDAAQAETHLHQMLCCCALLLSPGVHCHLGACRASLRLGWQLSQLAGCWGLDGASQGEWEGWEDSLKVQVHPHCWWALLLLLHLPWLRRCLRDWRDGHVPCALALSQHWPVPLPPPGEAA